MLCFPRLPCIDAISSMTLLLDDNISSLQVRVEGTAAKATAKVTRPSTAAAALNGASGRASNTR